jgi:hypothetical protein
MNILTDEELKRIIAWQPYRQDWPINRNLVEDNIEFHYGSLLNSFRYNSKFNYFITEDGGISNYIGIICYPIDCTVGAIDSIMVFISLCAPIYTYGQVSVFISESPNSSFGWGYIEPEAIGVIRNHFLLESIEKEIQNIAVNEGLKMLSSEEASFKIPKDLYDNDKLTLSLHEGDQLFHAIFQVMD